MWEVLVCGVVESITTKASQQVSARQCKHCVRMAVKVESPSVAGFVGGVCHDMEKESRDAVRV